MADRDPKGYYRRLGIEPAAGADAIKTAYRQLAKKLHPDINKDPNAKALFQAICEAYDVLSVPESRARYDALAYSRPTSQAQQTEIEPICCRCSKITAQPRSAVFYRVVSFVLMTFRTPIQGIYCSACARTTAIQASVVSGLFGWWGFPWGPIWTIGSIIGNAKGGTFSRAVDEKLLWYNAIAFFSKGNLTIAYALAQQARAAKDEEVALNALKLIDHLRTLGVATPSTLRNPWRPHPTQILVHLVLLLAVPGTLGALIYRGEGSKSSSARTSVSARPTPIDTTPRQSSKSPAAAPVVSTCPWPAANGQILSQTVPLNKPGHVVEIQNGSSGNAIIKLRNSVTGRLLVSFYVEEGNTASISNLPDGQYQIQYAFGDVLASDCRSFANMTSASQFPDIESLRTEYTQTQVARSRLRYTLYSVPSGNVRPERLSASAFNVE